MSWEKVKLGAVCEVFGGYAFKSENFKDEGIPLLRISNINDGQISFKEDCVCVDYSNLHALSRFEVIEGDILIALSGATTGKFGVYKLNRTSLLNQRVGLIRAKADLDQSYLLHYLNVLKSDIERMAQGAAQPNISTNEIASLEIPLPPIHIQKQIAEILDAADALRRKDQELLKKYDELAQAIFIDMFGDPVKNEKGWEVKRLDEVAKFPSGLVDPKLNPYSEMFHVGGNNIEEHSGRIIGLQKASELGLISGKFHFTSEHILYNKIRPYLNKVALPDFDGICSADMYPILPNSRNVVKEYLYYVLRSEYFLGFASKQSRRANIPKINMEEMAVFELPIPLINEQQRFVNLYNQVRNSILVVQNNSMNFKTLFDSLLQKAFKGELVKEEELV